MPLTTVPFDASIGGTGSQAEFTTGEQGFTCNFKAPSPDAGRAQMTVKTWYSEELAVSSLCSCNGK